MFRASFLLAVWATLALLVGALLLPWTAFTGDARLLYRWGVWAGGVGLRAAGVRMRILHAEPLDPAQPYLFLSNHASNLDPPLLAAALAPRRTAILIKQELLRIPLLGRGMRAAGFIPVARSGSVEDAKRSLADAGAALRSGLSLIIFPEGTRSPDGGLLPFKKGPFLIARQADLAVVPVTLANTAGLMPKGKVKLQAGTVEVTFHKALHPRDYPDRDAFKEAVRAAIASALPTQGPDAHRDPGAAELPGGPA